MGSYIIPLVWLFELKTWIWYLPHTPSQGGKDAHLPSWALDAGSTLGGGVGDLRPEMMKNA